MHRCRTLVVALACITAGCSAPARPRFATPGVAAAPATTAGPDLSANVSATSLPVSLDADVAALPDGKGAKLAVVVDDVGYADTYLADYLRLPIPLTLAVIPVGPNAPADDGAIHGAGKEVILHLPLANGRGRGGTPPGGLPVGTAPDAVDRFVGLAIARVPHAVGANNHEGSFGSASLPLMQALLGALKARNLFFLDSVTTQRSVGFSLESQFGMPPRINNVFMDHVESDPDSRDALLRLARIAAVNGAAIGICHVFHPYQLHALQALAAQLAAKGFVFAPLSQVSDSPAPGLDKGVRV